MRDEAESDNLRSLADARATNVAWAPVDGQNHRLGLDAGGDDA
jgi:hypothetical protein